MRLLLVFLLLLTGCAQTTTTTVTNFYPESRWIDRNIYMAYPSSVDSARNNVFQTLAVQAALDEIQNVTDLGPNYFTFHKVDESDLSLISEPVTTEEEFKSFILIWPDPVFNAYAENLSALTDQNAITVINSAYKRKFYIILKSSCFESSSLCGSVGGNGLRAIIARQLGLLMLLPPRDCASSPYDVMCTDPSDMQWTTSYKLLWAKQLNNALEAIKNSQTFYNEYNP